MGAVYSCADGGGFKTVLRNIFMPHTALERLKKDDRVSASQVISTTDSSTKKINPYVIVGIVGGVVVLSVVMYKVLKN
jgi:hypothetical protein